MKQQCIEEIIDFGDLPVFQKATTYPCILRISNGSLKKSFLCSMVRHLDFLDLKSHLQENHFKVNRSQLEDSGWSLADSKTQNLLNRLKSIGTPLGDYVDRKIFYGIKTGLNEAFVIDAETRSRLIAGDPQSADLIKPFLVGRDIKRYQIPNQSRYLILVPKGWTNEGMGKKGKAREWFSKNRPELAKHLAQFKEGAQKRCDQGDYWWELRACDYYKEFEKEKFILPDISLRANFIFDKDGKYYCVNTAYIISSEDLYLLGVLNSRITDFYYRNLSSTYRGGYLRFIYQYMVQLPIRVIDYSNPEDIERHDRVVTLVERMLELNKKLAGAKTAQDKTHLQRQIETTDNEIDRLVYDLYDLTEEEIALMEKANG